MVKKAAVIGGGAMGGGIAHLLAAAGIECFIKDVDSLFVDKAIAHSRAIFEKMVKKGKLEQSVAFEAQSRLRGGVEYDRSWFADVDLVIEAVPEILDLKRKVFVELEGLCSSKTILASNTSTLSIADMASDLKDKSRFVGLHFFNPAHVMKLVEVIYDDNTAADVVAAMMDLCGTIGKVPIKVRNAPGFVVNRILIPYMNEAVLVLMNSKVAVGEIDDVMHSFGMPMGPFALWDLVGLDVGLHASRTLEDAFGSRTPVPELLKFLVERGDFGQKTGRGFFDYTAGEKQVSAAVEEFVSGWQREHDINEERFVPERLMLVQVREALLIVAEDIASPKDVDAGMVYGTGFPARVAKGPLDYGENRLGWNNVGQLMRDYGKSVSADRYYLPANFDGLDSGPGIFVS